MQTTTAIVQMNAYVMLNFYYYCYYFFPLKADAIAATAARAALI